MKSIKIFIVAVIAFVQVVDAQISFNANTRDNTYDGYFMYGSNMGAYKGWTDQDLATVLVNDAGVNSLRSSVRDRFLDVANPEKAYDYLRAIYAHNKSIGAKNNVAFIGYPSTNHLESAMHCGTHASLVFKNLYEPIWVNGTVNPENYYAAYVYNIITEFGGDFKFWEVWNEPDHTATNFGNLKPGASGNWWDNDPNPCNLDLLRAPVQSYIRMLRISYEVIKSVEPDAYVCVGGLGYASFLDAILRNTDNPDAGKVTSDYPEKGGAWFDCISYHCYPMYYLRTWYPAGWDYYRNADAAADYLVNRKVIFDDVAQKHGYDGKQYPKKEFIITETNVPRRIVKLGAQMSIGSDKAQVNYAIKSVVLAQKNDIKGIYLYSPSDEVEMASATVSTNPYHVMGFFQKLTTVPGLVTKNSLATAWKTTHDFLAERKYSATETERMQLPENVKGGAFYSEAKKDYIYVIWAVSEGDRDHQLGSYTFPKSWGVTKLTRTQWDGTQTTPWYTVSLTDNPVFVQTSQVANTLALKETVNNELAETDQNCKLDIYPNPSSGDFTVMFDMPKAEQLELSVYNATGTLVKRLITKRSFTEGKHELLFNTDLKRGIYILSLNGGSYNERQKLVIE